MTKILKSVDLWKNSSYATLLQTKIAQTELPALPQDQLEVKRYLKDPVRYNLALELADKHAKTETTQIDFFAPGTNTGLAKLPEATQETVKNSMAHLSFRSGAYIGVILVYILMKFIVITGKGHHFLCKGF